MTLSDKAFYAGGGATLLLFLSYSFAPKRTRKTVDYMLNTGRAILNLKKGDTAKPVEVPDFETKQIPEVPDPRKSAEKQL